MIMDVLNRSSAGFTSWPASSGSDTCTSSTANGPFQATMDGETKKKVNPSYCRAPFWFRWGAAFTWVTGVLLLLLVFYHGGITIDTVASWGPLQILMVILVFVSPFIYDALCKTVFKDIKVAFWGGWVLATAFTILMAIASFTLPGLLDSPRRRLRYHHGLNVWFRICRHSRRSSPR
jgi:hypothetical protein